MMKMMMMVIHKSSCLPLIPVIGMTIKPTSTVPVAVNVAPVEVLVALTVILCVPLDTPLY